MSQNPITVNTVTIVLPTHNRRHLISRAIDSVARQTYQDWELIIVDDGSTDGTGEMLNGLADPRIRHVRNEKPSGPSNARNTGILAAAEGSGFLAFLDDDDEWMPNKLEMQLQVFRTSPLNPIAVGCGRIDLAEGEPEVHLPYVKGDIFEDILSRRARGYGAQLIVVRRQPGVADTLFDGDIRCLEDAEYAMRLSRKGNFDFAKEPLAYLYRNDGGPHAWNPAAAAVGYQALAKKYARELAELPEVYSYYKVCIAREMSRLGRMSECRSWLTGARRTSSRYRGRLILWSIATFLGPKFFSFVSRSLRVDPPPPRQ